MLTKVAVLILGLINEKPLNPYEITKQLHNLIIKDWFPISSSSVYVTIKTLNSKGYISGIKHKEGNMPDKTIYSVTKEGNKVLHDSLVEYISSIDFDPIKMNIAGFMIFNLERAEAIEVFTKRIDNFKEYGKEISEKLNNLQTKGILPPIVITVLRHNLNLVDAEIKTTGSLIEQVEKSQSWGY